MTHKARVLALLSDGIWHSHHQLYDLHVMGHSRVADLRRDGYDIECEKRDGCYWYRLLGKSGEGGPSGTSPSLTGNVPGSQTVEESTLLLTAAEISPSPEVAAAGPCSPPAPAAAQPSLFDLPEVPSWA